MAADLQPLLPWFGLDERESRRWLLDRPTSLGCLAGAKVEARIVDISTGGCLLALPERTAIGRYIRLALPHGIEVDGWIAWASGGRAGLAFARQLPPKVVEHLVAERTSYAA